MVVLLLYASGLASYAVTRLLVRLVQRFAARRRGGERHE